MVIYKYPITHTLTLDLPAEAKIVHAAVQSGNPCLWAMLDPEDQTVKRKFKVFGTGELVQGKYIATWQDGWLVWHLFEV